MSVDFILASGSPRRRELLAWMGWVFELQPVDVDETPLNCEMPVEFVSRLALSKARAASSASASRRANAGGSSAATILAADTTVADGTLILGKPANEMDARRMLRQLRGRSHQVFTALTAYLPAENRWLHDICCSQVPMRSYTEDEIEEYISSGDPMDKAGAYAIQNSVFHPVSGFAGCFANVMGLPLCHLVRTMHSAGLQTALDIPQLCRAKLDYRCTISPAVLQGEDIG